MRLAGDNVNLEPKFTLDEAIRMVTCLFAIQNDSENEEKIALNFQLYKGALFYLCKKLGAELEEIEEKQEDEFVKKILRIKREVEEL